MEKENRWTVEKRNIDDGGTIDFRTKAEALEDYRSMKKEVKNDYPEYKWKEDKIGSELHYIAIDSFIGERLILGDLESFA